MAVKNKSNRLAIKMLIAMVSCCDLLNLYWNNIATNRFNKLEHCCTKLIVFLCAVEYSIHMMASHRNHSKITAPQSNVELLF